MQQIETMKIKEIDFNFTKTKTKEKRDIKPNPKLQQTQNVIQT